jgi:hypothetical protein
MVDPWIGMEGELDLHGLTADEAVERFIHAYNSRLSAGDVDPLVVVHGYGSSGEGEAVIKRRIRKILKRHSDRLEYEHGEVIGNAGMTIVYPRKPLPTTEDKLEREILAYCSKPRTRDKIAGKFRKYGQPQVLEAIRRLERSEVLQVVHCGRYKCYQAASEAG